MVKLASRVAAIGCLITLALSITLLPGLLPHANAAATIRGNEICFTRLVTKEYTGNEHHVSAVYQIRVVANVMSDGQLRGEGRYIRVTKILIEPEPQISLIMTDRFEVTGRQTGDRVNLTWALPKELHGVLNHPKDRRRSSSSARVHSSFGRLFEMESKDSAVVEAQLVNGCYAPSPEDLPKRAYEHEKQKITRIATSGAAPAADDDNFRAVVLGRQKLYSYMISLYEIIDGYGQLTEDDRREWSEAKRKLADVERQLQAVDSGPADTKPDGAHSRDDLLARIEEIKQEIANLKAFIDAGFAGDDDRKELAKLEAELARLLAQMDDGPTPASDDESDGSLPPVLDDDLVVMPSDANVKVTGYVVFKDETSSTGYRPVKRVSLLFKRLGDPGAKIHATQSDDAGRYTVALPGGEYLVDVELSDEWAPLKDQPVTVKPDMDGKYFVAEKATLKRVEVTGIVVARSIVDPNKFTGVRNAEVVFQQRTERGSYKTLPGLMADGRGRFSDELEPGRYFVQAGASGFFNSRQQAVRIEQGMDPIEIELTRKPDDTPTPQPEPDPMPQPQPDVTPMPEDDKVPPCLLVVWVRDQQGQALSAVNLSIKHSVLGSIQGQTPTWAGSYSKNLVRGTAIVTASKPGYSTAKATAVMDSFSETINITLRKGGPGPKPGPNLKQNVTFIVRHGGRPVDGASVTVQRGTQSVGMALGKGNGQYQRDLPHGDDYEVTARWQRLGAKKKFSVPIRGPLLIDLR